VILTPDGITPHSLGNASSIHIANHCTQDAHWSSTPNKSQANAVEYQSVEKELTFQFEHNIVRKVLKKVRYG